MDEKELFEAGCFLPSWAEDTSVEENRIQTIYAFENKDLETLKSELAEIKEHIDKIREKQWHLAQQMMFHIHSFVKE